MSRNHSTKEFTPHLGALGRWLGQEGKALTKGICVSQERPQRAPLPLLSCEDTERRQAGWLAENQEAGSHQTPNLLVSWSWTSRFQNCEECACILSCFSCVRLFATPWTVAHQAPLSMGFSRQEYWSGLLFPPPGKELTSPAGGFFFNYWEDSNFL